LKVKRKNKRGGIGQDSASSNYLTALRKRSLRRYASSQALVFPSLPVYLTSDLQRPVYMPTFKNMICLLPNLFLTWVSSGRRLKLFTGWPRPFWIWRAIMRHQHTISVRCYTTKDWWATIWLRTSTILSRKQGCQRRSLTRLMELTVVLSAPSATKMQIEMPWNRPSSREKSCIAKSVPRRWTRMENQLRLLSSLRLHFLVKDCQINSWIFFRMKTFTSSVISWLSLELHLP